MPVPKISFEFFPPKSLEASFCLFEAVQTLAPLGPEYVSVTYGAGGTTRQLTHEAVSVLHDHYGLRVAAHLTCVDASRDEILAIAQSYADDGITDLVALRGDAPAGQGKFTPHKDGFKDTCELIRGLTDIAPFNIRVGAYPEAHPDAANMDADIDWLKRKFDAGASSAITQFFFEADTFFRFRDRCDAAGITAPIVPGILPIENWKGTRNFALRCGANVPTWLAQAFETAERDDRSDLLATAVCTELCSDLIEGGVEDLHFYTLNKPTLTREILHALGISAEQTLEKVA